MVLGADGVEVSRDQSTTASRLAQEVGKDLHLLDTVRERVPKRIEIDVDETVRCGWSGWDGWGDNVYGKGTPPILAGEFDAEKATKRELPLSLDPMLFLLRAQVEGKTFPREQHHVCKGYSFERRLVLGVRHEEGFANLRIAQDRDADVGCDFLEKDNVRTVGNLEYITEE